MSITVGIIANLVLDAGIVGTLAYVMTRTTHLTPHVPSSAVEISVRRVAAVEPEPSQILAAA